MVVLAIDATLPALPVIGAALSSDVPKTATLVIWFVILRLGIAQVPAVPISDVVGRKRAIHGVREHLPSGHSLRRSGGVSGKITDRPVASGLRH